jgi:multiple sugar transport system substrate-binding protein
MKTKIRVLSSIFALTIALTTLSACGDSSSSKDSSSTTPAASAANSSNTGAKDTVTALLPPVSPGFQANFDQMQKDFNQLYPNVTLKIEPASWEDMTQKLDTQVNAGSPPDIAFVGSDGISKYVQQGMLMDITDTATKEMVADYDKGPLEYMKNGKGLYGFPAYMEVHALGGNKEFLEKAGIDWKKVQKEGWTFDQFREAIKKGVVSEGGKTSRYGFVFATKGVAAKDYLGVLIKNAGMPAPFDKDLKFAYTSKKYLEVLKDVRTLIDDGSMPKELGSVDAGKRWNMFLTGQTMITGKGLATFENSANKNNDKIKANDGSAVKGSIPVDYIVLPVPTFLGEKPQSSVAVDGYVTFRGKKEPTAEHKANIVKAAYFLASGKVSATTNNDLFVAHITETGRKAAESMTVNRNPDNKAAVETMLTNAAPARPDIPSDLGAKAIKLEDEVIIPKLQALIAGEVTPEVMYEAVKSAAIQAFGKDKVVND